MNGPQTAPEDLDMGKAPEAPLYTFCMQYSFDFHQPSVDLESEAWMPHVPLLVS